MAKKARQATEAVFEQIERETKELLFAAVPRPNKQLCLFEDWADWNASHPAKNPKNSAGLTLAQEIFAQLVAAGHTKTEAYRQAYPNCKTENLNTVYPKACRLAKQGNIGARIEAVRKRLVDNALMSPTELYQRLTDMARNGGKVETRLKAAELIGKIHGVFKPEKETSLNISPSVIVKTVDYSNAPASAAGAKATGTPQGSREADK